MEKVLTIAGSDSSGGAGIQADLKTMSAHLVYGMSVITALTAQNTTGVYGVLEAAPEFVEKQIDCVFEDITPDAVKIGMVSNADIIRSIAKKLKEYNAKNIVCDPVMVATSGSNLMKDDAVNTLITELMPLASLITPNIPEAEVLCGFEIKTKDDMLKAAQKISSIASCAILIKGGHLTESSDDLLYENGNIHWFCGKHIENPNTHGTGCTLSSAIACNLAKGYDLETSVKNAKEYITGALNAFLNLGKGSGPLDHNYNFRGNK